MENKILIVDDDIHLSHLLQDCLQKEQIAAELCHDGQEGLRRAQQGGYLAVVLDIMLPGCSGFDILTALRRDSAVPVLMLTARSDEVDKISGFRLGADDYLTKPFQISEFVVRVQSLIRRYTVFNPAASNIQPPLICGRMTIDQACRGVTVGGQAVDLTGKEFDLLYLLASHAGKVFTKKQIYHAVWQEAYAYDDANIMSFISKLRKKLAAADAACDYIQTVWGVGYRFQGGAL